MIRKKKSISENRKWLSNFFIVLAWLMIISLVIMIPNFFIPPELSNVSFNNEIVEVKNTHTTDNYNFEKIPFLSNTVIPYEKTETEFYIIVGEIKENSNGYIKINEELIYPVTGSDTKNYVLVYLNDNGNIIRVEKIKGIAFGFTEFTGTD